MLFSQHASQKDLEFTKTFTVDGDLGNLSAGDYCRVMSFIDHWKDDVFIPKFSNDGTWAEGRQLASGRIAASTDVVQVSFDFRPCHNALITNTWTYLSHYVQPVTVVLPFLYTWVKFDERTGIDPEQWLLDDCSSLLKKHTLEEKSPIPFKVFEQFYNWYVDPEQNPVFRFVLPTVSDYEVYRVDGTPVGIRLTFTPTTVMKRMAAMFNLSRFLYDSFYAANTKKRRNNIVNYLGQGLNMTAAVVLSELNGSESTQCGHSIVVVSDPYTLFNWLAYKPLSTSSTWTGVWQKPHQLPVVVATAAKLTLHDTLKDWIKKGLIPDVYVHEDAEVSEGVRGGKLGVSLSGNDVRAGGVPAPKLTKAG